MASHSKITFLDAVTSSLDIDNNSTHSFSYTVPAGSSDRLVMLFATVVDAGVGAVFPPSATLNGETMQLVEQATDIDAADDAGVALFVLRSFASGSLPPGAYTVVITYGAATANSQAVIFTVDHVEKNPSLQIFTTNSNAGSATSFISSPVTTVDRMSVIEALLAQNSPITISADSGQTTLFNAAFNGAGTLFVGYVQTEAAGATPINLSFGTADYAVVYCLVQPIRRRFHAS